MDPVTTYAGLVAAVDLDKKAVADDQAALAAAQGKLGLDQETLARDTAALNAAFISAFTDLGKKVVRDDGVDPETGLHLYTVFEVVTDANGARTVLTAPAISDQSNLPTT